MIFGVVGACGDASCDLAQHLVCQREEHLYALITQLVQDVAPLLSGGHQPTIAQATEMVGDVGLREARRLHKRTDRAWPGAEEIEEGKAGRIGQSSKQLCLEDRSGRRAHKHDVLFPFLISTSPHSITGKERMA